MDDSDKFGTDDLLTKHSLAADFYANASPTISRYYALEAHKIYENLQLKEKFTARTCPYCCSVWRPNNVKITFKPRMKVTPKIKKLLKRADNNQMLGKYQSKVVKEFKEGNNKLVYTCLTCNKNTTQKIVSRPKKPEKAVKIASDPKKQLEKTQAQSTQKSRGNVKQCKVEKPKKRSLLECLMADRFKFQMATSGKR